MGYREVIIVTLFALFDIIKANTSNTIPIVIGPDSLGPDAPICTSYSSLCHLTYNISTVALAGPAGASMVLLDGEEPYRVIHSQQQVCRCPGSNTCETDWFSRRNSIVKNINIGGTEMTVKMSYCNLHQASRVCRQNEAALVLRGRGAFDFEVFEEFRCRCYRQLYLHRSWREGDYDYFEYSCGKPRCASNRHPTRQCTRITFQGSQYNLAHDYLCRCRRYEECRGDTLPTATVTEVFQTCQLQNHLVTDWNLQKRKRRRRHGQQNRGRQNKNKKN